MNWPKFFEILNYILVGILGLIGIVSYIMFFIYFSAEWKVPALWVMPGYYILFAVLVFATEQKVGSLHTYCKFLTVPLGKGLFFIYIGTLMIYYYMSISDMDVWPILVIVAACMFFLLAVLNICFHFLGQSKVEGKLNEYQEKLIKS